MKHCALDEGFAVRAYLPPLLILLLTFFNSAPAQADLVINELMYAPYRPWPSTQEFPATNRTQYVEIYNDGTGTVQLAAYRFDNGVSFGFDTGMTLGPGSYLVVADRLDAFTNAYPGVTNVLGNLGGGLSGGGERVTLSKRVNGIWITEDTIEYIDDPGSDGTGYSLELINPSFSTFRNQYFGDWVTSLTVSGTPGVVNSTFQASPLPVLGDVSHEPPFPAAGGVVRITATTESDTNLLSLLTIQYRITMTPEGSWSNTMMLDNGKRGDSTAGDGVYTIELPPVKDGPMQEGDLMEFRIQVSNIHGTRTFPATNRADVLAGPYSYFCKFGEDPHDDVDYRGEYQTFHILMTDLDKTDLQTRGLQNDILLDTTFITSDGAIFYNCGSRFRGGTSRNNQWGGYRVDLPNGSNYKDYTEINVNHVNAINQFIGLSIFDKTTDGISLDGKLTRIWLNSERKNPGQGIYVQFDGVGNGLMRKLYGKTGGNIYAADGDFRNGYIEYLGDTPSSYFSKYFLNESNPYTAWHEIIDFAKILNADATNYPTTLTNRMNVRLWARHMATQVCIDNTEAGFASPGHSSGDELRLYAHPDTGVFDIYPWDMDTIIGSGAALWAYGGSGAGALIEKFVESDPVIPYFVGDVYDIMTGIMSHESLTNFFLEMGSAADKVPGHITTFGTQRINLLNLINTNLTISGHTLSSTARVFPPLTTGNIFNVSLDQADFSNEWAFVGSLDFGGFSNEFVQLVRPNNLGSYSAHADAIMLSNAVSGTTLFEDDGSGFSTNGLKWEIVSNGGYTNGSYHISTDNGASDDSATWDITVPQAGVFDVYAWIIYLPGEAPARDTDYSLQSVQEVLSIELSGTAPQNYTARVTINGVDTDWDLQANVWTTTQPVLLSGQAGHISVRALDSAGEILKSIDFLGLGESSAQIVQGTISGDTTWNGNSGTFIVTNNLTVSAATTLTISPGTIVLFESGKTLTIDGNLDVQGLGAEPVYFASRNDATSWTLRLTAGSSMTVSNAHFHGGNILLDGGGSLHMSDSSVEGNYTAGGILSATNGDSVHLYRTTVRNYAKTSFQTTPTRIDQCLFERMTVSGVTLSGNSPTATVYRTTVQMPSMASAEGIRFDASTAGVADNCFIHGMASDGIIVNGGKATVRKSLFDACNVGIASADSPSLLNLNNTLVNCTNGLSGVQNVTNAIIWHTSSPVTGTPATIDFSDVEQPGTNLYSGTANLNRDPWFRNVTESDYRLLPISPARGSGLGAVDMGAYFPVGANPATPSELSLQAETNKIFISWTDNSGDEESGFEIERSTNGEKWMSVTTVTANVTNYCDEGLTQNTVYHYRLRASHERGASFYSATAMASTAFEDLTQVLIANLRYTEIMYNVPGDAAADAGEYVELKNISSTVTLDLSGLYFDNGVNFTFPPGTMLGPLQFFVLTRDATVFSNAYPAVQADGVFTAGMLSNGGERLEIEDAGGNRILDVTYGDSKDANWYPTTDGEGYSLVPVLPNPAGDPDHPVYWRASTAIGGSPGADDPNPGFGTIVINEVLAHNAVEDPGDWVEFCNLGTNPVDVSGWFLSDSPGNLTKYTIPSGPQSIIPANGYLVLTEADNFGTNAVATNGFAFSELGDDIILSSGFSGTQTSFRTSVDFGATENSVTMGRHIISDGSTDFTAMTTPTMGTANSTPLVGPIVINEIMYNPAAGGKEFVELLNITGSTVPLYDALNPSNTWEFDGAFEFVFPTNTSIDAGEHLLVVSGSPDEFRQIFGLSNSPVQVFGPYSGDLNNGGDSVRLYYPGDPEPDGFVPRIRTDRVKYSDNAPWPPQADNDGFSLEKRGPALYGNDPTNWTAASVGGTPGVSNNTSGLPSVGFATVDSDEVESASIVDIVVNLLPSITSTVVVEYAVSGGTATPASDFTLNAGTLIFWPHETSKTIPLAIINDNTPAGEPDETVEITLTTITPNAFFGGNRVHTHTIVDNDATTLPPPIITPAEDTSFTNSILVTISNVQGSIVYYTLNGHRPTRKDTFYIGPFTLAHSARVAARTFLGSQNSGGWTNVLLTEAPKPLVFEIPTEPNAILAPVLNSNDDGWEVAFGGEMHLTDASIELGSLVFGSSPNFGAAFRFETVGVPQGATITNAYVQFTAAQANTDAASFVIYAEATSNSVTMTSAAFDISSRPLTTASTPWAPPAWNTSARGSAQRTPDISAIITEIISQPDWVISNALTIVIDYVTVASRWVRTFEGAPDQVAALRVQWEGDTVEIPVIYGITSLAADSFTILWISDPENSYAVYRSTNLMFNFPGDLLTNGFAGDPIGTNVYTDTNAVPPAAFYSIGIDNP